MVDPFYLDAKCWANKTIKQARTVQLENLVWLDSCWFVDNTLRLIFVFLIFSEFWRVFLGSISHLFERYTFLTVNLMILKLKSTKKKLKSVSKSHWSQELHLKWSVKENDFKMLFIFNQTKRISTDWYTDWIMSTVSRASRLTQYVVTFWTKVALQIQKGGWISWTIELALNAITWRPLSRWMLLAVPKEDWRQIYPHWNCVLQRSIWLFWQNEGIYH